MPFELTKEQILEKIIKPQLKLFQFGTNASAAEAKALSIFNKYDADGNGSFNQDEFQKACDENIAEQIIEGVKEFSINTPATSGKKVQNSTISNSSEVMSEVKLTPEQKAEVEKFNSLSPQEQILELSVKFQQEFSTTGAIISGIEGNNIIMEVPDDKNNPQNIKTTKVPLGELGYSENSIGVIKQFASGLLITEALGDLGNSEIKGYDAQKGIITTADGEVSLKDYGIPEELYPSELLMISYISTKIISDVKAQAHEVNQKGLSVKSGYNNMYTNGFKNFGIELVENENGTISMMSGNKSYGTVSFDEKGNPVYDEAAKNLNFYMVDQTLKDKGYTVSANSLNEDKTQLTLTYKKGSEEMKVIYDTNTHKAIKLIK